MHIPTVANILPLIVLLVVTRAEWEVFNGPNDAEGDELNLMAENLIPADGTGAKGHKASQGNLASFDQTKKQNVDPKSDPKTKDPKKQVENPSDVTHSTKITTNKEPNNISNVKKTTPQASTAGRKVAVDKLSTTPKTLNNFDDSDIKSEGFLLVEDVKQSRTSRKLAQFFELFSQESEESIDQMNDFDDWNNLSEDDTGKHQHLLEDETNHPLVDVEEGIQPLADSLQDVKEKALDIGYVDPSLQDVTTIAGDLDPSLKLACIDYLSWECLMFREDYMAMKNMSIRTSGRERIKRQASSGTGSTRGSQQMSQILDCEHGDCFSGNGTDSNEECVSPQFSFGFKAKVNTNQPTLDAATRQNVASEAMQQLSEIFKDVPGFRNASIDSDRIVRTTDRELVIPWKVYLDGGNSIFYGLSGQQVRNLIVGNLTLAADSYNTNFKIDGQQPKNVFSGSDAADQVQGQASDPCKMNPSPCSKGFGSCQNTPCQYNGHNGMEVVCTDNCHTHPACGNGVCDKDVAGKAYCRCRLEWAGLYCDRANVTTTPLPDKTVPKFNFSEQSKFNTTLKPSDLTPEKRADIAKNLTDQLKGVLKNLPGLQNVTVNPNDIRIDQNGQLVVDWGASLDPNAYSGKNSSDIGDTVHGELLNVSPTYRNGVVIDGQKPIEDLDPDRAAEQIENAARDPCSTDPCPPGYDNNNCIAVDSTHVTCIHNCNNNPVCQHEGTCQIDSAGTSYCQCPSGWSGKSCEERNKQLDGGEITGIVLGGALLAAGTIGCICWFLLARTSQKDVNFTNYTDEECRSSFSSPSSGMFFIDRPNVRKDANPMYSASPYPSPHGSQASNSDNGS